MKINYSQERELQNDVLNLLAGYGYTYNPNLKDEESIILNLKRKIELINNIQFSNDEWENIEKGLMDQFGFNEYKQGIADKFYNKKDTKNNYIPFSLNMPNYGLLP